MNPPRIVPVLLASWFGLALALGYSGLLLRLPTPAIPAFIATFVVTLTIARHRFAALRRWAAQLDPSGLVLAHAVRFVGLLLWWVGQCGALAEEFARTAGIGDTIVAVSALVIVLTHATYRSPRLVLAWNLAATADLLYVASTAVRLALAGEAGMRPMFQLPLSLMPTFLVPLLLSTHVLLFEQLWTRIRSPTLATRAH